MTAETKRSATIEWSDPMPLAQAARTMAGIEFLRATATSGCPGRRSRS
jgi:hypothetical protein